MNYNAGYIAKDKVESFAEILKKFNELNSNDLKKMSKNATKCFKKNFDLSSNKNSLGELLKKNLK